MYALKLVKDGVSFWCFYIGSATDSKRGFESRIALYEHRTTAKFPQNVQKAFDYGFRIEKIGVLAWCPKPQKRHETAVRAVCLGLEVTFSVMFWAFHNTVDNSLGFSSSPPSGDSVSWDIRDSAPSYGKEDLLLQPRSSLNYLGLCSHLATMEPPKRGLSMTKEQKKAQRNAYDKRFYSVPKNLAKKKATAKKRRSTPAYREKARLAMKKRREDPVFREKFNRLRREKYQAKVGAK